MDICIALCHWPFYETKSSKRLVVYIGFNPSYVRIIIPFSQSLKMTTEHISNFIRPTINDTQTQTQAHSKTMPKAVVQLLLQQGNKILLGLRQRTGVYDQHWSLPCGKVERLENIEHALYREAYEELGIELQQITLLAQRIDKWSNQHFIFLGQQWRGQIHNQEPHLCQRLQWFDIDRLPNNCAPITLWITNLISYHLQN